MPPGKPPTFAKAAVGEQPRGSGTFAEAVSLTLLAALPAFMNLNSHQIFEEQKSLLLVAGALVALPGVLSARRRTTTVMRDAIVLAFLTFVVMLFIASIGPGFDRAFWGAYVRRHGLLMWVALAVLFVAMCDAARREAGQRRLVLAIVIGTLWPSVYLLLQRLGSDPISWVLPSEGFESGGTFGNRVLFGGYLAIAIPLTTMVALRASRVVGVLVLLQVTALMAAGSRGAVVAVGGAALAFAGVAGLRRISSRTIAYGMVAVAIPLVVLIAVPALRPELSSQRFNLTGGSARVRMVIWQDVTALLQSSGPRLAIGHGPESLARLIGPYYSAELARLENTDMMPDRAHNEFLDTLVNGGVVGLALELSFLALVMWRLRAIEDTWMRAGLMASLTGHLIEIQFGIATVASRLAVLAIAAVAVGLRHHEKDASARRTHGEWLFVPAAAAALSPFISTMPARSASVPASGSAEDFIAYLDRLAAGTTWLYVAMLAAAALVAWRLSSRSRSAAPTWASGTALAACAILAVPLSLRPTWADGFTAAGMSYEANGQWMEAAIAHRESCQRAPEVAYYRANVGRALINLAMSRQPAEREELLREVDVNYRAAFDMEPFDPDHSRHLAALLRIRASIADEQARVAPLEEADRVYAGIIRAVPDLPSLWIEWAYVDFDRGRRAEASRKLDRAAALGGNRHDQDRMAELRQLMAK